MSDLPTDIPIGGGRINSQTCDDPAQIAKNWALTKAVVDPINSLARNPDVPPFQPALGWVRFQLTSVFTDGLATANIFDDTWTDTGVGITVYDIRDRYGAATGDEKGVANLWGNTPVYEIIILDFSAGGGGGGGGDDIYFRCSADDSTSSYAHAKWHNVAAYAADADINVAAATVGGVATNQKERFFVDVSAIPNYSATGVWFAGLDTNVSKYLSPVSAADAILGAITLGGLVYDIDSHSLISIPGRRAVSTSVCSAATGIVGGSRTPGTGTAKLYTPPAANSPAGTAWTIGGTITYENWMESSISDKKPILLRPSRIVDGEILYEIDAEGCKQLATE